MNICQNCQQAFKPAITRQRFCCTGCQSANWQRARRTPDGQPVPPARSSRTAQVIETAPEVEVEEAETVPTIHETAQKLIVSGYLPPPFQIDPHDQRPLWDINGISALFDRRPDELLELLLANGPAHLPKRDVPSSWRALIEC